MSRVKVYTTAAERQQAYRQRLKEKSPPVSKEGRKSSRPQRFQKAVRELEMLGQEYETWLESLPENLSQSQLAEQLQEAIEQLQEVVGILDTLQLPLGFGR